MQSMQCCGLCAANIENGGINGLFLQVAMAISNAVAFECLLSKRLNVECTSNEIVRVGLFAMEIKELKSSELFGICLFVFESQ